MRCFDTIRIALQAARHRAALHGVGYRVRYEMKFQVDVCV